MTGATGFIGRVLVRRLLEAGEPIQLFVRRPPPAPLQNHPLVNIVLGDLRDASAVDRATAGVEVVYHLGSAMSGSAEEFDRATLQGTANVIESCLRHGVRRLVYMSSLSVVDADEGHGGRPIDERSATERYPSARGNYSRAKTAAELAVRQAVDTRGLPAILLRPGEVVSAERPLLTPGVAQPVGPFLVVIGDGTLRLPLVHVADVVEAALAAAETRETPGSIFHLVDDCGITQNEIIAHYRSTGTRCRVVHVPIWFMLTVATLVETAYGWLGRTAPLGRRRLVAATARRTYDCAKAARALHWTPRVGARAALGSGASPASG